MAYVRVKLTDADTGMPIPYAVVFLDSLKETTDEGGSCKFTVPPGTYTLRVRSQIYEPYVAPVTVTEPGVEIPISLRAVHL